MSMQRSSSKYLPCLLTRLTDENPFDSKDSSYGTEFSVEQLRSDILVNLSMLLNSHTAPEESKYLEKHYPLSAVSVFHYGIDSYAGRTSSFRQPHIIAEAVRRAIVRYEPRVQPASVQVLADPPGDGDDHTALHLHIACRLAVTPLSDDLYFRLRVDVETGETSIKPVA